MLTPRPNTHDVHADGTPVRAAAYVRMSTDHQQYSIENQMRVISDYAHSHGVEIVRTYADAGRSGLTLQGRDALRQLISDVREGGADFAFVLVYDVSRWGRFQDIDESAHYEFICRKAGVLVEYCAEGFQNDGSIVTTLIKGMKRAMAGEFSRELSSKVFEGHARLVRKGFHQGGTAGFGLRRILVDRKGRPKGVLQPGQEKNLQNDRVILAPGPNDEVQVVREVFRLYVEERLSLRQIARLLNQQGIRNGRGNSWTQHNVSLLLRSERYIGNLVYNRTSLKLQSTRVFNAQSRWIRSEGAIEPIVDPEVFALAKSRLNAGWEISDNDLLNHLTAVWCIAGYLSCKNMAAVANTPSPNTYQQRFGSLQNAYRLLGYKRTRNYRYAKIGPLMCRIERELISRLTSAVQQRRVAIRLDPATNELRVDGNTSVTTVVLPYSKKGKSGRAGWWLYFDRIRKCDLMLVVRMTELNTEMLDCHLLPFPVLAGPSFRFTSEKLAALVPYRLSSMDEFCDVFSRLLHPTAS